MTQYSPSAAKIYQFCSKKYYFHWLAQKKHGWRKSPDHPWHRVYSLKPVKGSSMWAGELFHQVIAGILKDEQAKKSTNLEAAISLAEELAQVQFEFSRNKEFVGAIKSKVPSHRGYSKFLSLFEHVYGLPDDGILDDTLLKVERWLRNIFAWDDWKRLIADIRIAKYVYVEPERLWYSIGGAKISARMDLGIERNKRFTIYDWKCYQDDEEFVEYNEKNFRCQLLIYALWPMMPDVNPLPVSAVSSVVFNPTNGTMLEFSFSDDEIWDLELEVERWARFQQQVFTDVSEIDFEDLSGPRNPERVCPWCQYKSVCGANIEWHNLT